MSRTKNTILRVAALFHVLLFTAGTLWGCDMLPIPSLPGISGSSSEVRINEIVTSNSSSLVDEALGSPDWIELYNPGSASISLSGCHLSDNTRNPKKWEFPDVSIGPGEHLIIYAVKYEGEAPPGAYCTGFGLSKSGETLYLTDRHLGILDSVNIPPLRTDVSYARDENGSFGFCGTPTPGTANTTPMASRLEDVRYASADAAILLNEALPVNTSGLLAPNGSRYPWAELYNAGQEPLRLLEFWLSDDPTNFKKYQLPDALLQPGGYAVVFFSGNGVEDENGIYVDFRLGSEDTALYLANGQGQVVSELSWEIPMPEDIAVVQTEKNEKYTALPTPGAENSPSTFANLTPLPMDDTDPVILNEVLVKNRFSMMDADGDRPEWAELYNRSSSPVSLYGYALSDNAGIPGKWLLPDITMEPGGYLLIFLSGKNRREGELHASFGLSVRDEALILTNLNGMRQDVIPLDAEITPNVSMGKGEGGGLQYFPTPTPGAKNDSAGFELLSGLPGRNPDGVFISEVKTVSAPKKPSPDWIELYNPTDREINLEGWGVSNDIENPMRYTIQSLTVPPGGHKVIQTSNRTAIQTGTMGTFGISASGDTIFLTDASGLLRDYFEVGFLTPGRSSGRVEDDTMGRRVYFTTPTPGEKNASAQYEGYVAAPVFSETALYHTEPFSLSIRCATTGARIYYTLDGASPTPDSALYQGPVSISKNTPVRAIAVQDGLLNSEAVTMTYLFEEPHTLPVISINGSQENFTIVNSATERSMRTEREMHMAYYEQGGRLGVAAPCGLRASGSSTLTYAQKSFTMYFRGGYGRSTVTYPFFPGYHINRFSSLVIRNAGQDRDRARLRDSYYSLAVEGMQIDNVATRPVIVYINGVYWGLYDLNENQNEDFLADHYGVDPDKVDIIRRNLEALAGTNRDNKRVRAFGRERDLSIRSNYEEYCQWVDVDYIIDYIIAQTFFSNGDMFNQKYWRSHDYTVKWRPIFYDVDLGFSSNSPTRNILPSYFKYEGVPSQDLSITNMDLYCGLPANAEWREKFIKRYIYIVETHLNAPRLTTLLDEVAAQMRPEMERHIKRWHYPSSVSTWENNVKGLRECLEKRPPYALKSLCDYFNISSSQLEAYRQETLRQAGLAKPTQ